MKKGLILLGVCLLCIGSAVYAEDAEEETNEEDMTLQERVDQIKVEIPQELLEADDVMIIQDDPEVMSEEEVIEENKVESLIDKVKTIIYRILGIKK